MTHLLKPTRRGFVAGGLAAAAGLAAPGIARAQNFYDGRSIELIIASGSGGFDFVGRLIGRHISKYIPGNPPIVPRNMPGAGGLVATNYFYNIAERNGLVIGQLPSNVVSEHLLQSEGVQYNAQEFNWIGRFARGLNFTLVNASTGVRSLADAKEREVILATTGPASLVHIFPDLLNKMIGTRFRLISGYTSSAETLLAMDRGEADGVTVSWNSMVTLRSDPATAERFNVIVQYTPERIPEMPEVETVMEALETDENRQIYSLFLTVVQLGQQICFPPDVPQHLIDILRQAYWEMTSDPDFLAEIEQARVAYEPLHGAELQQIVHEAGQISPELLERARALRLG